MPVAAPCPFDCSETRITGWKAVLPHSRPLATPAVAAGKVFLGGGFGSHEFYAFDAATGQLAWEYHTHDDGPTAAVVDDGCVAFNTESCELEVLSLEGHLVWKKWLGDPLMSMPAIGGGRIYMAYPDSRGDHRHYLACFDLRTGQDRWKQPISGEIITAPVLAEGRVYLSTLDGTLACFDQATGQPLWREESNATSSPVVWQGQCYYSRREEVSLAQAGHAASQQTESLSTRSVEPSDSSRVYPTTTRHADYLDYAKRKARSPVEKMHESSDTMVGFGTSKGHSKIEQARKNLGHGTVAGIWAYQGSKPFLYRGRLYSGMGDTLNCVDPASGTVYWKKGVHRPESAEEGEPESLDSVLTPPALVNDKLFVGTTTGEVICLLAATGEVLWKVDVGEPVVFQPAVAQGKVYVPTGAGSLYCLDTGDHRDDGWLMWGANPAHNGVPAS
jgi:Ca-activated chloride channel family protein